LQKVGAAMLLCKAFFEPEGQGWLLNYLFGRHMAFEKGLP
jgi:hypothetical protein